MPTDMARGQTAAARFALSGVAWSLGLFGLLRLNWVEAHLVLPLTRLQGAAAGELFGASTSLVRVTLACSGTDALALCLGAILAYPVTWQRRLWGACGGIAVILCLNTVRIGTLGLVAREPLWFNALHVYVWPALLLLAIAGYVFTWMRVAERPRTPEARDVSHEPLRVERPKPTRRFVVLALAFLILFTAASPLYLESSAVLALAAVIAQAAAALLSAIGVEAHAAANVLRTSRGAFLVTQECISTPLIPIYLAAVSAHSTNWRRLTLGLLAAAPIFIALGIVRLLVVALPGAVVASPLFLIHAFYQLLLAAVLVFLAAHWRHGGRVGALHALTGVVAGVLFVALLGSSYTRLVTYPLGHALGDPQGAIALLPSFQVGLYFAVWIAAFLPIGWKPFLAGLAILALTQTTGLLALDALATHSGLMAHVRDIRGWAVVGPLLVVAGVVNVARARR